MEVHFVINGKNASRLLYPISFQTLFLTTQKLVFRFFFLNFDFFWGEGGKTVTYLDHDHDRKSWSQAHKTINRSKSIGCRFYLIVTTLHVSLKRSYHSKVKDKACLGFALGFPMPQTRCLYLFSFTTQSLRKKYFSFF